MVISTGDNPEADFKTDKMTTIPTKEKQHMQSNQIICCECGMKLTLGVRNVSLNKYGRPLCMKCQKKLQGVA